MEGHIPAETAFFVPNEGGFQIRWFTPTTEVNLCGHATLASAFILFEKLGWEQEVIRFESKSGNLPVCRSQDGLMLDFPSQPGIPCETPTALVKGLGRDPLEVLASEDYMAVFEREEDIVEIRPDLTALRQLDRRGVIATAKGEEVDFVGHFFAPNVGIDEDPVTGSAHCMLIPYWAEKLQRNRLSARQLSKRTGEVGCELQGNRVLISGNAVLYLEGMIHV
ncbi:PhzF family phenazine biosynthesis protein [Acidobacteria bacterium AH-259-D05]|nr:PhzF family phenazine biosynthesis protein [Acidobacteria bacterium AH-259-D05]